MSDFNGPSRQYPYENYKSGVYQGESPIYKFGPKSSEYPNLALPYNLFDEHGEIIPNGYYMVVLSSDMKFLELYQSNELKARVKVVKLVEKMFTKEELDEEAEITNRLAKFKNKKLKKYQKAKEDLEAFEQREAANSYATIEDSGEGYYIIKYNCFGKQATAIVQK